MCQIEWICKKNQGQHLFYFGSFDIYWIVGWAFTMATEKTRLLDGCVVTLPQHKKLIEEE